MKKFLFSMMAIAALFATSCEKDGGKDGGATEPAKLFPMRINVEGNSATITVWPKNYDIFYYWDVATPAEIEEMGGLESMCGLLLDYFQMMIAEYQAQGLDVSLADILYNGKDSYTYSGLDQNSEYVCFAFGVDMETGVVNTAIETQNFTTGEAAPTYINLQSVYIDQHQGDPSASIPHDEWYIEAYGADDDIFYVAIATEINATSLAGTYNVIENTIPGFFPGQQQGSSIYPSFWGVMDAEGYLTDYALLSGGLITIAVQGVNYEIDADMSDDAGAEYFADYYGPVTYTYHEFTTETAAIQSAKRTFRTLSSAAKMIGHKKISIRK